MSNKENFINEKKQKINSIGYNAKEVKKHVLTKNNFDLKRAWEDSKKEENNDSDYFKAKELEKILKRDRKEIVLKRNRKMIKFFSIFITVVIAIAFYFIQDNYYKDNHALKKNDINIVFTNKSIVKSFSVFPLSFKIKNNSGIDIVKSRLTVKFPRGTIDEKNVNELSTKFFDKSIVSNGYSNYKINISFLPSENDMKKIEYEFKYNVKDDEKTYVKKWTQVLKLEKTPIEMKITYPEKVNSEISNNIKIEITSNADEIINDISVIAVIKNILYLNYSTPNATISNNIFYIKKLEPGETKKIILNGYFIGKIGDKKNIKVRLVKNVFNNNTKILSNIMSKNIDIKIEKKDIQTDLIFVKNKDGDIILNQGVDDILTIKIKNNLNKNISNVKVKEYLPNIFFNKYSIIPQSGFYDSNNGFVLWDKNISQELSTIKSENEVEVRVKMSSRKDNIFSGNIKNPETKIKIDVSAEKNSNVNDNIFYTNTYNVKLNTVYSFIEESFESNGSDIKGENYDSYMKVGNHYRFLIRWSLKSSTNDIDEPLVKAFIPHYIKIISNDDELDYDSRDRILSWKPEKVKAFSGYTGHSSKNISFIIEYVPTVRHIGATTPYLIGEKEVSGTDAHTYSKYFFGYKELDFNIKVDE